MDIFEEVLFLFLKHMNMIVVSSHTGNQSHLFALLLFNLMGSIHIMYGIS